MGVDTLDELIWRYMSSMLGLILRALFGCSRRFFPSHHQGTFDFVIAGTPPAHILLQFIDFARHAHHQPLQLRNVLLAPEPEVPRTHPVPDLAALARRQLLRGGAREEELVGVEVGFGFFGFAFAFGGVCGA